MDFKLVIRDIHDFPQKGILFRDITPVLKDPDYFRQSVLSLKDLTSDLEFDIIAGPESRGFIFGVPLAYELKKGFIPVRKAGKLPFETYSRKYTLEYGEAEIEIHKDALKKGQRVLVVDDLLATGGTCKALCELVEKAGAIVTAAVFFIELSELSGRAALSNWEVRSLVKY